MTTLTSSLDSEVVTWLARLPFLAAEDLALLTGKPERVIESVLRELDRSGWTDWIAPSSPEMDSTHLFVLTEAARRSVADQFSGPNAERTVDLPLSWRDITQRLVRLEATVVLNVFAAGLVTSARRDTAIEVQELRALPVRRPRDAWWPGGVHAYGCLARPGGFAPFFVAVDRAAVPTEHRRALVAAWYAFCESDHVWGRDGIPPILVICDQPEQEEEWAEAVLAAADRRRVAPLAVLLTHRSLGFGEDPGGVAWRTSENLSRATLNSRLPRARRFQ